MTPTFSGYGGRRPLLEIPVDKLHLDPLNPRFSEEGKNKEEMETLYILKKHFDLDELAFSIAENGYFDEEPLIVIPDKLPKTLATKNYSDLIIDDSYKKFINHKNTNFTVVEGNRRLGTVKILLSDELKSKFKVRSWPDIDKQIEDDITNLPAIVYPDRKGVLPYLGVRHITGIKKWEAYSKASYVVEMREAGLSLDEIQKQVGDRTNSIRKIYCCYKLIEKVENEFDIETFKAKNYFSYLILAVGQGAVKQFLGIPKQWKNIDIEDPIPDGKLENLKDLFAWLFGEGKDKLPVINESRDITNLLSPVLRNEESVSYLKSSRNLKDAYERSDGERCLLLKKLNTSKRELEGSLGIINRYRTEEDVILITDSIRDTIETICKIIKD